MAALRNNRIIESDFWNRSCAFEACLELILLGDPLKIFFQQHRSLPAFTASQYCRPLHLNQQTLDGRSRTNSALRRTAQSCTCLARLPWAPSAPTLVRGARLSQRAEPHVSLFAAPPAGAKMFRKPKEFAQHFKRHLLKRHLRVRVLPPRRGCLARCTPGHKPRSRRRRAFPLSNRLQKLTSTFGKTIVATGGCRSVAAFPRRIG